MKAKFCRDRNYELRKLAKTYNIPVHNIGKVVVARDEEENSRLNTLYSRGIRNGVEIEILEEKELFKYEPLAITHERFLWSPNTAVSDSQAIAESMQSEFLKLEGKLSSKQI